MVTEKLCNQSEKGVDLPLEKEVEPVEPVQVNIYQSNAYRKEPRVQESSK